MHCTATWRYSMAFGKRIWDRHSIGSDEERAAWLV